MDRTLNPLREALGATDQPPSHEQRLLARALGQTLLDSLAKRADYAQLNGLDSRMLDVILPKRGAPREQDERALRSIIDNITDPERQRLCCDVLARLGHMHQMAGLLLRDLELESATTPKTAVAFLEGKFGSNQLPYTELQDAVNALNKPRLELTFTGHPTNTNSLSSMIAQREIGRTLHAWRKGKATDADMRAAFDQYANAPLLPERPGRTPGLSVRDEAQTMLYFLNNAYEDIDTVYAGYDRAMSKRFADYDPSALRLGLRYHSWGSSADKDGNANVNADTTLYALAAHYQQILQRYRNDLNGINGLDGWKTRIDQAQDVATGVLREIESALDDPGHLDAGVHDHLRSALKDAVQPLDKNAFITALEQLSASPAVTSLIRHVHGFGFSFGTLEYRETAVEFSRIIKQLIPGYAKDDKGNAIDENACRAALTAILDNPEKLRDFQKRFTALGAGAEGKPYSKADIAPIAYHTRKRLELARDFPQAIDNHVLAECQDTSNLLELLLLQKATAHGSRAPHMGIVPLFEDSGPLEKAPDILRAALDDPHYRQHLDDVATTQGASAPAQQMQLAHSDNARRNGLPAARALIYRAHQQLRSALDEHNAQTGQPVELQFYEGGSLSDPYRGGVRAISAAINEYGLHGFSKMTVQGGDLLNYFNLPDSTYRVMMRNFTHNAARLEAGSKGVSREGPVIEALAATKEEYKELFNSPEINDFAETIGFDEETKAGNTSSRAGARPNGGGDKPHVDVTTARTISFSEGFQHAGLTPTWIGSLSLPGLLQQNGISTQSPRALNQYYRGSPVFKDAIDRMLFGLVRSDMPYLRERSGDHALMQRFEHEYAQAFQLCMEAYTGKPISEFTKGVALTPKQQHDMLLNEVYPHVADVFTDQDRFTDVARQMKRSWLDGKDDPAHKPMLLHNAMDTVLHGRLPLIDDPTYATLYCRKHGIQRPHGPTAGAHLAA